MVLDRDQERPREEKLRQVYTRGLLGNKVNGEDNLENRVEPIAKITTLKHLSGVVFKNL